MRDLIIVGAGPVGTHLGKLFSEDDRDVLILEQSEEVGKPLACSGHVSPDIWDYVPEDKRQVLEQNRIRGARFHNNGEEYRFYRDTPVSYVIDRVKLDKVKAEEARGEGVDIITGEKVKSVEELEDRVKVETAGKTYRAKLLAGCDGASSTVRSEIGLEEPGKFYQGVLGFTQEEDDSDFVDVMLEVPGFFGWRIPRGESVEYGAAVPQGENTFEWIEKIAEKFEADPENICAGGIPVRPVEKSFSKRVFLVGDSAGQVKPFTGGGILYGLRCAEIAGQEIDIEKPESLESYDRAWREELRTDFLLGSFIEHYYSLPGFLRSIPLRLFQGRIGVHMDHPSTLFSWSQLKAFLR